MVCSNRGVESGEDKEGRPPRPAHYRMLRIKEESANKCLSIAYAAVISIVLLALDTCNFAGVGTVVARQNEKIVQRFTSFFYGKEQRDQLAALLYTDAAAALDRGGWPMRMTDFADVLYDLATPLTTSCPVKNADPKCKPIEYKASAGFFGNIEIRSADHDPAGFCELIETINRLTGIYAGEPVSADNCLASLSGSDSLNARQEWLGMWEIRAASMLDGLDSIPSDAKPDYFANTKLAEMRRISGRASVLTMPILMGAPLVYLNAQRAFISACYPTPEKQEECDYHRSTFLGEVKNWPGIALLDLVAILVPLDISADQGRSVHLAVDTYSHASPPWLIAKYLKNRDENDSSTTTKQEAEREPPKEKLPKENLYTVWGRSSPNDQQVIDNTYCSKSSTGWFVNLQRELIDTLFPPDSPDDLIHKCPYHATLDMADIDTDELTHENFKTFTADRFVFFGLSMQRFSDAIDTPLYGKLPSIFHQLMATDNLLTQGDKFYRAKNPIELQNSKAATTWESFLQRLESALPFLQFLIVGALFYLLSRYHTRITDFLDSKAFLFTQLFLCVAVPASLWLLYAWLWRRWPEISLFGALVSLLFFIFIVVIVRCWFSFGLNKQLYGKNTLHNDNLSWMQRRYSGLVCFAPHLVVLGVAYLLAVGLASLSSILFRVPPPNGLVIFVSFVPIYLSFHGGQLGEGMKRLSGSQRVADKVF